MHSPEMSEHDSPSPCPLPKGKGSETRSKHDWTLAPFIACGFLLAAIGGSSRNADGQIQVPGFGRMSAGEQDPTAGVYLPTDRTLSRAVVRARERLAQHEYQEALTFLHGLLGREEDWFFEAAAGTNEQRGVKATARQLIGDLPAEGHDAYELLHGSDRAQAVGSGALSGNRAGVSQVVRQFFHTNAGYEAAL